MATANLGIPYLAQNVAQPEVPENEAKDILDGIAAGILEIDISDDTPYTILNTALNYPYEIHNRVIKAVQLGGFNSGTVSILLPNATKGVYAVHNATTSGFDIRFSYVAVGTEYVDVPPDAIYQVYCDGTKIWRMT